MINLETFVQSKPRNFRGGQSIFRQGEPGDIMYVIAEGAVDIFVDSMLVETAGPGSVIGEMAMIDERSRSATAKAKIPCKLLPVDRKGFESLISRNPSLAVEIMRIVVERLRRADILLSHFKANKK